MRPYLTKTSVLQAGILLLLTFALFFPVTLVKTAFHDLNDIRTYTYYARSIAEGTEPWSAVGSHPGWAALVIAVYRVFGIEKMWQAVLAVQMGAQLLLALVLYGMARSALPDAKPWLFIALPLALMIATPVFLLALEDGLYYFGYVGITSYHNPTNNVLKPLALLLIPWAVRWAEGKRLAPAEILLMALLVLASTLIKPNFLICLLPAVGIQSLARLIRRESIDWRGLVLGLGIPSVLVLGYEYLQAGFADSGGIILLPFAVMKNFSGWLGLKALLSVWFPLLVTILYWLQARKDAGLVLGWLAFAFGAGYTYLLAEGGNRIFHGNFVWSGEIALFCLFVLSALFFFRQRAGGRADKKWLAALLAGFLLHILAGIIYYAYTLMNNTYF